MLWVGGFLHTWGSVVPLWGKLSFPGPHSEIFPSGSQWLARFSADGFYVYSPLKLIHSGNKQVVSLSFIKKIKSLRFLHTVQVDMYAKVLGCFRRFWTPLSRCMFILPSGLPLLREHRIWVCLWCHSSQSHQDFCSEKGYKTVVYIYLYSHR